MCRWIQLSASEVRRCMCERTFREGREWRPQTPGTGMSSPRHTFTNPTSVLTHFLALIQSQFLVFLVLISLHPHYSTFINLCHASAPSLSTSILPHDMLVLASLTLIHPALHSLPALLSSHYLSISSSLSFPFCHSHTPRP